MHQHHNNLCRETVGRAQHAQQTPSVYLAAGTHPRDTTAKNCRRFREQLRSLGFSYDWDREISTTDPEYYKCARKPKH